MSAHLTELLKHGLLILFRYAHTCVPDRDHKMSVQQARIDVHPPPLAREFHSVREQIEHDLLEFALVGRNISDLRFDSAREHDILALRALAYHYHRILQC